MYYYRITTNSETYESCDRYRDSVVCVCLVFTA